MTTRLLADDLAAPAAVLSVPAIIFATLSILVVVAAAIVFFRAAYAKAQIEALRGDRDDLMARTDILEKENTRVTNELKAARMQTEVLEQLVTGKAAVQQVLEKLSEHDARLTRHSDEVARLEPLLKKIDKNTAPHNNGGARS